MGAKNSKASLSVMFPGRLVQLERGCVAEVFPLGASHIKRFSKLLASTLPAITSRITVKDGEAMDSFGGRVLGQILPFITEDLFELLEACVVLKNEKDEVVELGLAPHWFLPPIINEWLSESFGTEEKWRPWITAFKGMTELLNQPSLKTG